MAIMRRFPSSKNSHFQNKNKYKIFIVKMSFMCMRIKKTFLINGFALSLALKPKHEAIRK